MVNHINEINPNIANIFKIKEHSDYEFFNIMESIIRLNHSDKNFNVTELSHLCRICKSHLREQIRQHYGFPPHFLIENIRLECALYMLVLEIRIDYLAKSVGYGTTQTFRRAFKRRLHLSPTEFRKVAKNNDENCLIMIEKCKKILWNCKNDPFFNGETAS